MFFLLSWLIYGLLVGFISKAIHPGNDPVGWLPTMLIGIAGSYVGGIAYYFLSMNLDAFRPAGFLLSVLGGVIFLSAWRYYVKQKNS